MVDSATTDPRRSVPRTDFLLHHPDIAPAVERLGRHAVLELIHRVQQRVRSGELDPATAPATVVRSLPRGAGSLRRVLNATGVVLHTNLGRAPLSDAACQAVQTAAGYTDLEFDLAGGQRSRRGAGVVAALRRAVPAAQDALVVNNGAAALWLAMAVLAGGRTVVMSRGEMVEIGDGFRLPELIEAAGTRIREVGTTNRTSVTDFRAAIDDEVGCVLKVHPSNFRIEGFTAQPTVRELAGLGVPLVVDIGSGLLSRSPVLPAEPDASTTLTDGAAVVTASGDKLLGGPQAGLLLGRSDLLERMRRHPVYRALRADKLRLAALEATVDGPPTPVQQALENDPDSLRQRCAALAEQLGGDVVPADGAVGGGSAPGTRLPGWALRLPEKLAAPLRVGEPSVVGRLEHGWLLLDLRCVPEADDALIVRAVRALGH